MENTAYLSLGANLGNRIGNLQSAIDRLQGTGEIRAVSSVYETEPVEFTDQPWFLNAAAALETGLAPLQLLNVIQQVEREMGRERAIPKGPRTIDIDILLFGDAVIREPELVIPHPAMQYRRFVLEPLAEIAPAVCHPLLRRSIAELLQELRDPATVRHLGPRLHL